MIDLTSVDPIYSLELTRMMRESAVGYATLNALATRTLAPGATTYIERGGNAIALDDSDGYDRTLSMGPTAKARGLDMSYVTQSVQWGRKADAVDMDHRTKRILEAQGIDVVADSIDLLSELYLSVLDASSGSVLGNTSNYDSGNVITSIANIDDTPSADLKTALLNLDSSMLRFGGSHATALVMDYTLVGPMLNTEFVRELLGDTTRIDNATDVGQLQAAIRRILPQCSVHVYERTRLVSGTETPMLGLGKMAMIASHPGIGRSFANVYREQGDGADIGGSLGTIREVDDRTSRDPLYSIVGQLISSVGVATAGTPSYYCGGIFTGLID